MNTRFFALVLALACFLPALSQAAGRVWTVRYAPSFSVATPAPQPFSIRSAPLNIQGNRWSIRNAVAPTIQNSVNRQINNFSTQTARVSRRRTVRRSSVGQSGHGVNSSGFQFPLN